MIPYVFIVWCFVASYICSTHYTAVWINYCLKRTSAIKEANINYRGFLLQMDKKSTLFVVNKDEWVTKEGSGKSMKNALHVRWYGKRYLSSCEAMWNSEKVKPVALTIVELRASDRQLVSQSVENSVKYIFLIHSNLLKAFQIDLKACFGLRSFMQPTHHLRKLWLILGEFTSWFAHSSLLHFVHDTVCT